MSRQVTWKKADLARAIGVAEKLGKNVYAMQIFRDRVELVLVDDTQPDVDEPPDSKKSLLPEDWPE